MKFQSMIILILALGTANGVIPDQPSQKSNQRLSTPPKTTSEDNPRSATADVSKDADEDTQSRSTASEFSPGWDKFKASSRDIPVLDRLRGVERRPPVDDPNRYVSRLCKEGANVITLGGMNGQGYVFYPSQYGPPHPRMDPNWLAEVIRHLRREDIGVLCWVCFNVQDVRQVDDFVPGRLMPQWQMKYIEDPDKKWPPKAGMCLISSPFIEYQANLLQEMARFDLDGFFFDGFYLTGIPHPGRAGCVCDYCRDAFKKDTGLVLPYEIDFSDRTFKRWVRWRNDRLLKTAHHFQSKIHEINPRLTCTFNFNIWPFGNKDWETGIPVWRLDNLGVSQHGYSTRFEQKWLMMGFKARIGRDINPGHTDMWRAGGFQHTGGSKNPDLAWHKLEITTHLLAGLTYGITPWHSTIAGPVELTAQIHGAVLPVEKYFSRRYIARVAVLYSQNTHDFYGHIPGTDNLNEYRDAILGTWMTLTEHHIPFEFVFDNQAETLIPDRYRVLILPNAAALSQKAVDRIGDWVSDGGHLIMTANTAHYDEWGEPLPVSRLESDFGIKPHQEIVTTWFGKGKVTYLLIDPGLAWCRARENRPTDILIELIGSRARPFDLQAPNTLVGNLFESPTGKAYWLHLLNISPFMPEGDSGFRGLNRPVKPVQFVHQDTEPSSVYGGPLIPAQNLTFRLRGIRPQSAYLVRAKTSLPIHPDGTILIPEVKLHEVLILEK